MKLRDYQEEAVQWAVTKKRSMIVAPAGSGKTVIGAHVLSRIAKPGQKITWLAATREQVEQAAAAIAHTEGPECDLNICCAAANPDTSDSDIVVLDECHHVPCESYLQTVSHDNGQTILGLTATPWHSDEERNIVVRAVFQEFFTIERERLIAHGHLVPGKVYMYDIDVPGIFDADINAKTKIETDLRCRRFWSIPRFEHERRAKWMITSEAVQANAARNQKAIELAIDTPDSTLVLVSSIEHGTELAASIPGAIVVHSKMGAKKRGAALTAFRSGELRVMVATSLMDEGADVPRASRLVLVAGGRSAGKLEQRAGRILRPFAGKESGIILDFLDRGAQFAHAQAKARMKVYERLGYDPEIVRCIASERAAA